MATNEREKKGRGTDPLAGKGAVPGLPAEEARSRGERERGPAKEKLDPDGSAAAAAARESGRDEEQP